MAALILSVLICMPPQPTDAVLVPPTGGHPPPLVRQVAHAVRVHPSTRRGQVAGHRLLVGLSTWYGTGPGAGDAAAGPRLRHALGSGWRGTRVRVSRGTRSVVVRLSDWCKCPNNHVIDLSDEDFSRLAPLSRGVIRVAIAR